jgi:hypothetical protein
MNYMTDNFIPEPFQFNPLKHHLAFIREFIAQEISDENPEKNKDLVRKIRHIGTSVMDIYTGNLRIPEILEEVRGFLKNKGLLTAGLFADWTGKGFGDFRVITLSDGSQWTLKYHTGGERYVHLFPARSSPHSFRIKTNTLNSALLYIISIGKDYISDEDLNRARALAGLSPVKEVAESEAISELIEILRAQ